VRYLDISWYNLLLLPHLHSDASAGYSIGRLANCSLKYDVNHGLIIIFMVKSEKEDVLGRLNILSHYLAHFVTRGNTRIATWHTSSGQVSSRQMIPRSLQCAAAARCGNCAPKSGVYRHLICQVCFQDFSGSVILPYWTDN
jgi:hypothetical protein